MFWGLVMLFGVGAIFGGFAAAATSDSLTAI